MFSSIQQAALMSIRYSKRHRSISAGKVDSIRLLTAGTFPRLNERGSIEADVHRRNLATIWQFPRLNERGSIEAFLASSASVLESAEFPRLNERGSIEALYLYRDLAYRLRRFHV